MNKKKIESIIKAYKIARAQNPDGWLIDCTNASTLENAIELGATARNSVGRKHSHQFRIPSIILDKFALAILAKKHIVATSADFHELISTIESCKIKGVSDLTVYDTAQRIGEYMNLYPNKIYLHRGTRNGAEILLGKIKGKYLTINQLPQPFQSQLSAAEIEDILCIYKNRLATCI